MDLVSRQPFFTFIFRGGLTFAAAHGRHSVGRYFLSGPDCSSRCLPCQHSLL